MSERATRNLLEDIYDAATKIIAYTNGMSYDDFMDDDKTIDAVVRNFEIIGEAAIRVPDDFKTGHPEIEWHRIIGFRNRIIHGYFGIDYEILWKIRQENVPGLSQFMEQILNDINDEFA